MNAHSSPPNPSASFHSAGADAGGCAGPSSGCVSRICDAPPRHAVLAYRPDLSPSQLSAEIAGLRGVGRFVDRLLCLYLADFGDRIDERRHPQLARYADVYQAAQLLFDLSARAARERVRIGRALRQLPLIDAAFAEGRISYSAVREITRVAQRDDERAWVELADRLSVHQLEQRVAEAGGRKGNRKVDEPASTRWKGSSAVELRVTTSAETWALLQRAMEGARRESDRALTDSEALDALARDALGSQSSGRAADPRTTVVLYECARCKATEVDTGRGPMRLDEGAAATLGCGATVRDLETEGRVVKRGGSLPEAIRRAVLLRDRSTCQVPGCRHRRYVDVHHLELQAAGGEHSRENCVTLCTWHHRLVHDGQLRVHGNAEGKLRFEVVEPPEGTQGDEPKPGQQGGASGESWSAESERAATHVGHRAGAVEVATTHVGHRAGAVDVATTHVGQPEADVDGATHVGRPEAPTEASVGASPEAATQAPRATFDESASDRDSLAPGANAERVLAEMRGRGGWHPDTLCERTGLSVPRMSMALTQLELAGRIERSWTGLFSPR